MTALRIEASGRDNAVWPDAKRESLTAEGRNAQILGICELMLERQAQRTADFCIRIMEQSLNRANAADAAPRARPSDRANSSVVSPLRASPGFRGEAK